MELNILVPKYRIYHKGNVTLKDDLRDIAGLLNAIHKNNLKLNIKSTHSFTVVPIIENNK